jgi:hypothetical protein
LLLRSRRPLGPGRPWQPKHAGYGRLRGRGGGLRARVVELPDEDAAETISQISVADAGWAGGRKEGGAAAYSESLASELGPADRVNNAVAWHIDKGALTLNEPRRNRDLAHLRFVSAQPCLICGRRPSDAHHLRFAQPRALGRRVSDEYAVPLCRSHHRALHRHGDEAAWWETNQLEPVAVARELWRRTRLDGPSGGRGVALSSVGVIEPEHASRSGLFRVSPNQPNQTPGLDGQ